MIIGTIEFQPLTMRSEGLPSKDQRTDYGENVFHMERVGQVENGKA